MRPFKLPKDNEKYRWTGHVVRKMIHYRLTPSRVLRIIRAPERLEAGVAQGTVAGMQRSGTKQRPAEIWAMWRDEPITSARKRPEARTSKSRPETLPSGIHHSPFAAPRRVIITAWRYPGTSPVRDAVPIPDDVLSELRAEGLVDT